MKRRAMLLMVAMAAALVVGSGVALAANIACDDNPCLGTPNPDSIDGTTSPEKIKALAGNDFVVGRGGNDEIYGDEGNDLVDGFPGNDTVYGGPGGDGRADGTNFGATNLEGSEDSDTIYGGGGNDLIDAAANDFSTLTLTAPVDSSYGGRGNDIVYAIDNNNDIINCGGGKADVAHVDGEVGLDGDVTGCEQIRSEE